MRALNVITLVLSIVTVLAAIFLALVGYLSIQFALNDGPARTPVPPSWSLIAMVIAQPLIVAALFPVPAVILIRRGASIAAFVLSVVPYFLGFTFRFWWPAVRSFLV